MMRFLLTFTVTTTMVATGGYGAFPNNPITQIFQQEIGQNFPEVVLKPFNSYMENIAAPTIQPQPASDSGPALDLIGTLVDAGNAPVESAPTLSSDQVNALIAEFSASMTAVAANTATAYATLTTQTPSPTLTFIPTITPLPSLTSSPTLTQTPTLVWIYIPPTKTPRPADTDTPQPTMTTTPPTSTPVPYIVLYQGSSSDGNIGGSRSTVDANCSANLPSGYTRYNAFLSFSDTDDIYGLSSYGIPTNVPVKSTTGNTIANNWADMFDGTIAMSLSAAGVTTSDWWSGVEQDGRALTTSANCFTWSDNSASPTNNGNVGSATITTLDSVAGTSWLKGQSTGVACNIVRPVLCIGY
jgi:hypothetical protein